MLALADFLDVQKSCRTKDSIAPSVAKRFNVATCREVSTMNRSVSIPMSPVLHSFREQLKVNAPDQLIYIKPAVYSEDRITSSKLTIKLKLNTGRAQRNSSRCSIHVTFLLISSYFTYFTTIIFR